MDYTLSKPPILHWQDSRHIAPAKNLSRWAAVLSQSDSIRRVSFLLVAILCVTSVSCGAQPRVNDKADSISFGQRQVDQLLADRPDMAGVLREDDPVLQWVIEGFNGDRMGYRIHWHANSPLGGSDAEHSPPYYAYPAYISLSGGAQVTPIDKWASVVYELHNIENSQAFDELHEQAKAGEIDGEAYAKKCLKLEFLALEKTKEFFEKNSLPNSRHGKDPWYNWISGDIGTFEDYAKSFEEDQIGNGYNPLKYFRDYYDTGIAPYLEWYREHEENSGENVE